MRDLNPRLEMCSAASQFAGLMNGGSFVRSGARSPFSDPEKMELALELLEVRSDAELEQFLGDLSRKAWRGIKSVGSKVIEPLGGLLQTFAKRAMPFVATAAGTAFGGPAGGPTAGKLGSLVSQTLRAEVAGLAAAERDLEKCRQFVRLAGKAVRAAASAPSGVNPIAVAQNSLVDWAKEKRTRTAASTGLVGNFAEGAPAAAAMRTGTAVGRAGGQKSRKGTPGVQAGTRAASANSRSGPASAGRSADAGRWFQSGNCIIVNC
jgi:hypothetical protein